MDTYPELIQLLKSTNVVSFIVEHVESRDLLFTFTFTLMTNHGIFISSVDFDYKLLENMTILFRPEFGEVLKQQLIVKFYQAIKYNEEFLIHYIQIFLIYINFIYHL
jgi:hypothetical protein